MHLYEFDRELYNQLTAYPGEVIPLLDVEARYIAADLTGEELPEDKLLTVRSTCPSQATFISLRLGKIMQTSVQTRT